MMDHPEVIFRQPVDDCRFDLLVCSCRLDCQPNFMLSTSILFESEFELSLHGIVRNGEEGLSVNSFLVRIEDRHSEAFE